MKNITNIMNVVTCTQCEKNGFFTKAFKFKQMDSYYKIECPFCKYDCYWTFCYPMIECGKCHRIGEYDGDKDHAFLENYCLCIYCNNDENNKLLSCCSKCRVFFVLGCLHTKDNDVDIFNAHLIRKWEYIPEKSIHIGMPQVETLEEHSDIRVLEWVCPNNNWVCESHDNNKEKCGCNLKVQSNSS